MALFRFGVATEPNDCIPTDFEDEVWMKNENGELVLIKVEEKDYESSTEGK